MHYKPYGHFVKSNMDKVYTQEEIAAFGFEVLEARRKGGKMVLKKYGPEYFSKLAKLSNKRRQENKEIAKAKQG